MGLAADLYSHDRHPSRTTDAERGKDVARRVRTGTIGINKYLPDPAAPFGGIKASGIGRELGPGAISSYQQLKSIYA
ncbi:MAG: aldehyde dehydrogenase family protein [Streptosporangiaceae bacterium]